MSDVQRTEWKTRTLDDCAELLSGGTPFKGNADFWFGSIPWVSAKDMKTFRLHDAEDHISDSAVGNGGKVVPAGTILLLVRGMTLHNDVPICMAMRDMAFNQDIKAIRPKADVDNNFLAYWFLANKPDLLAAVDHAGHGTGRLLTDLLKRMLVPLPPLPEQKAIASILGALDDKIELNRRMNATLEAMAQALFQSWFVDFDPVRAKLDGRPPTGLDPETAALFPATFQDSPLGHIPEGWRVSNLAVVIDIFDSKRIPLSGREREKRHGLYPYYGAASVMDHIDDFLFDGIYVLMGEDGSVINVDGTPVLQYVWGKFWVNNHAHVLRGKNGICTEHLLLHLKNCNITPFVTGAVQPKLNQGNMNRIEFIVPTDKIGHAFEKKVDPLFAQIRSNAEQSCILSTLRDTLLPKLLSGELSVAEFEKVAAV